MTQALPKPSQVSLYDRDLNLWLETAIAQSKAGNFHNLDVENLVEESEGLTGRDKRGKNRFIVLLEHLLKRLYVDMAQKFNGWQRTIWEQHTQIEVLLEQSPSLKTL